MDKNWFLDQRDENQTFFYGPNLGDARVGFYITKVEKDGKSYKDAARKSKEAQKTERMHSVIEENDISGDSFKALMRRSSWYAPSIDMMLYVREIFTESVDAVYVLSASIPNSPELETLDKVTVQMMNSFRLKTQLKTVDH